MNELQTRELRLSELHLPEIKRDDIARSLAGAVAKVDWPRLHLPSVDVGKAISKAASAAHIRRRARRPRWPLAVGGLVIAGLAGWAMLSNRLVRARLADGGSAIREGITAARSKWHERRAAEADDPIAFNAAETAPIEASPYAEDTVEATAYPSGLGSSNGDGTPASVAAGSPA